MTALLLALAHFLFFVPQGMAPGPGVKAYSGGGSSTITISKTTNFARVNSGVSSPLTLNAATHLLVATINIDSGTATVTGLTCTGASCSWVQGTSCLAHSTTAGTSTDVWYVQSAPAGITDLTVTLSGVVAEQTTVYEFSGQNATAFDSCQIAANHVAAANPSGPAITPSLSSEAVLATLVTATNVTAVSGGFTSDQIDTSGGIHVHNYTATSGTFTPTYTMTSGAYAATTAAFK